MSAQPVATGANELVLPDDYPTLDSINRKLDRILAFCDALAQMLDAMGDNPMIAAMMPPGFMQSDG